MAIKTRYIRGETITFSLADAGYTAVSVSYGDTASTMVLRDGSWTVRVPSTSLAGKVRYAILVSKGDETECVESGNFTVSALRSHYRDVVEAIDKALQGVATNGKYSVNIGEVALQDKTFDEMIKALQYYKALAEEDEVGETSLGKVGVIETRFV